MSRAPRPSGGTASPCEVHMRIDIGRGCTGITPEHRHTETMGWPPGVTTWMLYLTWGAPLTINGKPCAVFPLRLLRVTADTPHGVPRNNGRCPVTGLRRTVVLVSIGVSR